MIDLSPFLPLSALSPLSPRRILANAGVSNRFLLQGCHMAGKTSLLMQLGVNCVLQGDSVAMILPSDMESPPLYPKVNGEAAPAELLKSIRVSYCNDDQQARSVLQQWMMLDTNVLLVDGLSSMMRRDTYGRSSRERLSNLLALATNVISRRAGDDAPGLLVVSDVIDPVLSTLTPILSHFLPITLSLCINDEAGDNRHNRELKVRTAYGQPAPPSLSWFIGVDDHGCSLQVLHQK